MNKHLADMDPLAAGLIDAIKPLIKSSQAQVMAATADFEFTFSQTRMLFVLDHHGADMTLGELADQVSLSLAAAGRAVEILVRMGMVSRREDEADRRIKRIGMTPAGHRAIDTIHAARKRVVQSFVQGLSDAERNALASAVATLGELTRKHLAEHVPTSL
ncbi:DNA-binding MarR family transcriptional regulator [Luteibacter sp. Sphag1AF]|uniref:MarR family winged helix-turn-helix transcriptional regulator n=1 Tax=Luteibacter sp. Sphag1AF TaxID=2587031 RepID=UPI0016222475|nr:MarR family transcriptional regulator [Luteibacter sp. Sphag1AF]MBB3225939.1 DNA-binding MarR family transcriptional regulator [Luteibacter sp. Sphag1AF]